MFNFKQMDSKGYGIYIVHGSEYFIENSQVIQKNDEIGLLTDDDTAAELAVNDGIKFINDLNNIPSNVYIDCDYNRELLQQFLSNATEEDIYKINFTKLA